MSNKKSLIEFFENYDSISDTGLTWSQVGEMFDMSADAARRVIKRYREKESLKLVKSVERQGIPVYETFKNVPESENPDVSNLKISKVTKNPYGGEWITYTKENQNISKEDFITAIKELNPEFIPNAITEFSSPSYQIINITDCHIGMNIASDLFNYKWNIEEFNKRLSLIHTYIDDSNTLVINQLGDYSDNIDGYTARKTHTVPSNLTAKETIRRGSQSFIGFVDKILDTKTSNVIINWLTNSNHAPLLDYAIGLALANYYNLNDRVVFNLVEDYFFDFKINNTQYCIVHGKDEQFMFKGLPRFLKDQEINQLNNIFKYKKLDNPVLLRGDQHAYHDIGYQGFRDILTPSLANPSAWIQYNFASDYKGGFTIINEVKNEITAQLINFK